MTVIRAKLIDPDQTGVVMHITMAQAIVIKKLLGLVSGPANSSRLVLDNLWDQMGNAGVPGIPSGDMLTQCIIEAKSGTYNTINNLATEFEAQ